MSHAGERETGTTTTTTSAAAERTAPATDERRATLVAHLESLERSRRALSRERRWIPWLALAALAAVPVALRWGPFAALFTVAAAVTAAVAGAYISWAHRREYSDREVAIRQQLADVESAGRRAHRPPTPWRVPGKPIHL